MTRIVLILTAILALANPAYAVDQWEGIEMATLDIDGVKYEFPVGDADRRDHIYYLKKAVKGDVEAAEMFFQGKNERWFFIGKEYPLWLKVYKHNGIIRTEVIKP